MAFSLSLGVTPESLSAQAGVVEQTIESIARHIEAMQHIVASMDYWKGQAGEMHRNDMVLNEEKIAAVLQQLRRYPIDIRRIAGNYSEAESNNKGEAIQLASGMTFY